MYLTTKVVIFYFIPFFNKKSIAFIEVILTYSYINI